MLSFLFREYLEAVRRNKAPKTSKSAASKINLMGEIYSDSPGRKSGIDIGITGVRFFKLPHKVRQCMLWKRHFHTFVFKRGKNSRF